MGSLSVGEVNGWLEGYRRAWEEGDADAAAALFTEDAVYRSSPFREPHVGTTAIRDYLRETWNWEPGFRPPHEGWGI